MRILFDHLRTLGVRMLISGGLLFLSQLWFLAVNQSRFVLSDAGLWWGMAVFLLAAVCFVNVPLAVIELLPIHLRRKKWYRRLTFTLFLLVNAVATGVNLFDAHFFGYTLKRSTADVFDMVGRDTGMIRLLPAFLRDYWATFLFWMLLIWLAVRMDRRWRSPFGAIESFSLRYFMRHSVIFIGAAALMVMGSRGGLRLKPLAPISAHNYTVPANVPLVLNTPFTIIRTLGSSGFTSGNFFSLEEAGQHFSFIVDIPSEPREPRPNFVLVIMESFGNEYAGRMSSDSPTPFLDSLLQHSLSAKVGLANGRRSIDALPAMISGIPQLMNAPFISSVYGSNQTESCVARLGSAGYSSAFFHGGANGTMGFDDFAESAGFQRYIGLNEYPFAGHHDGAWGIFDEEFFAFAADEINRLSEPFFSAVFSLSSHHPYTVPPHRAALFSGSDLERSVRYADFSLRAFFRKIASMDWPQRTVFIITADHSPVTGHPFYGNPIGRYLVPIAFYSPDSSLLPRMMNPMVQHADIPGAVLRLSGIGGRIFTSGGDPFNSLTSRPAFGFADEVYQWADDTWLYRFDGEKTIGLYRWSEDSLLTTNLMEAERALVQRLEKEMKSALTLFGHSLNFNQMTAE